MNHLSAWQPVVPSHQVRAVDNIVAGFFSAGELALWRDADGNVQAWENRCPHRGTRLTLGRIIDGKLSCAYHGWEFAANGGRCSTIPAHPAGPAPKNLCVATYSAHEAAGMVWVRAGSEANDANPEMSAANLWFCRSLGITAPASRVDDELAALNFERVATWTWVGHLASQRCTVFTSSASDRLTFAHVWLATASQTRQLRAVMAALAGLRERSEKTKIIGGAA
jgi:phenylpropionate dioxygenase-like ring-hydroxylating dioxygenase large terminal subunit